MVDRCPGSANLRTPMLIIRNCPDCGSEIEIFTTDRNIKCSCGFLIYNNIESCIKWCVHAEECIGEELYRKLKERN